MEQEKQNKVKQKLPIIIIVILLLFSVSKCTQSCNRQYIIEQKDFEIEVADSVIKIYEDSITSLNHKIELLSNDNANQEKIVEAQRDAMDKINEAKKNINVTVKNNKH